MATDCVFTDRLTPEEAAQVRSYGLTYLYRATQIPVHTLHRAARGLYVDSRVLLKLRKYLPKTP